MGLRVAIARSLIRAGKFIQSTALMVMKPDDLIEFGRQSYARKQKVVGKNSFGPSHNGLYPDEKALLGYLPELKGRLLLLGMGDGREAIPFARLGLEVTGVDFIPEVVELAIQNAARRGLEIEGLVQDISSLEVEDEAFDFVWLSVAMYSSIPTKKMRIGMLRRIHSALKPSGYFICQFHLGTGDFSSPKAEKTRKALAWLTLGNLSYESGDILWQNLEFIHGFHSKDELHAEFSAGGFEIVHLNFPENDFRGGAILRKS